MMDCYDNQLASETKDKLVVKGNSELPVRRKQKSRALQELLDDMDYAHSRQSTSIVDPNRELYIVTLKAKPMAPELDDFRSKVDAVRSCSEKIFKEATGSDDGSDLFCGIYDGEYKEFSFLLLAEEVKKIEGVDEVASVRPMDILYCYGSSSDCSPCVSDESDSDQASDESGDLEQASDS